MCARFTEDDDGINEAARFPRKDARIKERMRLPIPRVSPFSRMPAKYAGRQDSYRGNHIAARYNRYHRAISILDFIYNRVERSIRLPSRRERGAFARHAAVCTPVTPNVSNPTRWLILTGSGYACAKVAVCPEQPSHFNSHPPQPPRAGAVL